MNDDTLVDGITWAQWKSDCLANFCVPNKNDYLNLPTLLTHEQKVLVALIEAQGPDLTNALTDTVFYDRYDSDGNTQLAVLGEL